MEKKIRIGFGPETPANSFYQSGVNVAERLNAGDRFEADVFDDAFDLNELMKFDVLIFIKILPKFRVLRKLKKAGKVLILDYHDTFLTPASHEVSPFKKIFKWVLYFPLECYQRTKFKLIDRCFVASQESMRIAKEAGLKPYYLFRQIFNGWNEKNFKQHNDKTDSLTIIWTGVRKNIWLNAQVEPVLKELCERYHSQVIYLTDAEEKDEGWIKYKRWSLETWEKDLLEGDIAFRWWLDSNDQRHKDSNKVISYMAAGLPVVCRPTDSDKNVMDNGKTGFFADTPQEFIKKIEQLILDPCLRSEIGQRAHQEVWSKYSLNKHVEEIKKLVGDLVHGN